MLSIKPDHWIRRQAHQCGMIEPFEDGQVRDGVIVTGVVVKQSGRVGLVTGEGAVGLEVARRGALRAVGVVRAAGLYGGGACGKGCTSQMVAVQMVECGPALDRNAQAAEAEL